MKNVLFWGVLLFLLPQALYVRKTAPRFGPAGGQLQGSSGDGRQTRLLAVGDSIIAGVGATELSKALVGQTATAIATSLNCCVSWQALGVSGYNSTKILDRKMATKPVAAPGQAEGTFARRRHCSRWHAATAQFSVVTAAIAGHFRNAGSVI